MDSKKIKCLEVENRRVVTRTRGMGEMGTWRTGAKLQLLSMNKSRALIYSMVTAVYNTVLNSGSLLRQ